jgi:ABC-type branched-subunit amino acid transport system ATPase component
MLAVENIDVFYGDAQALDGVSLEVEQGAIVAIVGANGAGKTSLIRTIAGMLRPASGAIRYRGEDIAGLPSFRVCNLGVGQVAEGRQVFPTLTVADNLRLAERDAKPRYELVHDLFPVLRERARQRAGRARALHREEVAGQEHEIGLRGDGALGDLAQARLRHERAEVRVGDLHDAQRARVLARLARGVAPELGHGGAIDA